MGVGVERGVVVDVGIEAVGVGEMDEVGSAVVVGGAVGVGRTGWFEQLTKIMRMRTANVRTAKEVGGFLTTIR